MICSYAGLFISIWHTRRATPLAAVDMDFALRFFFIVLTNLMCWAPVYVLRLMVLFKYPVPGANNLILSFDFFCYHFLSTVEDLIFLRSMLARETKLQMDQDINIQFVLFV